MELRGFNPDPGRRAAETGRGAAEIATASVNFCNLGTLAESRWAYWWKARHTHGLDSILSVRWQAVLMTTLEQARPALPFDNKSITLES